MRDFDIMLYHFLNIITWIRGDKINVVRQG